MLSRIPSTSTVVVSTKLILIHWLHSNSNEPSCYGSRSSGICFQRQRQCALGSSGPSAIEDELVKFLASSLDFGGSHVDGVFGSGGSTANMTALTAARDEKLGLSWSERSRREVYLSDQTNCSIVKCLRILGFGGEQIRSSEAMKVIGCKALKMCTETDLRWNLSPFLVVATRGTINTGSIDPLDENAPLADIFGLWMHVDGAYGASVVLLKSHRALVSGIQLADSVA
jgi:L-2,4-diaminobutyrate decarboxylase